MYTNEATWAGEFGDEYHKRNPVVDQKAFWSFVVRNLDPLPKSVIELGAGKGDNLIALHSILPDLKRIVGVDVNESALEEMLKHPFIEVWRASAWALESLGDFDMVITRGFLIHVPKFQLFDMYELLGTVKKHVVMAEYIDKERREIPYQGEAGLLWADDYENGFTHHPFNRGKWEGKNLGAEPLFNTTTCVFTRR